MTAGFVAGAFLALAALALPSPPATAQDPACPNAEFRTGPSASLPDCRAYEMASPLDKGGANVHRHFVRYFAQSGAAASGGAVAYSADALLGVEQESGAHFPTYLSARDADGWNTRGLHPPFDNTFGTPWPSVVHLSPELSTSVVISTAALTPEASFLNGSWPMYLRDNTATPNYRLLGEPPDMLPPDQGSVREDRFQFAAATPDSNHVVFNTGRQLLPEAPPDTSTAATNAVYEWADGDLRLVSVLPPGVPPVTGNDDVAAGSQGTRDGNNHPGDHLVSEDGERIYFTVRCGTFCGSGELYVREGGTTTRLVTASERAGDDPDEPREGEFWAAEAAAGSVALFASTEALTDDAVADPTAAEGDLYRWDADAPAGERLTDLTTTDPDGAFVLGPTAVSDDATRAYFVAEGELAPGATAGEPNLYLWEQGAGVRHVATLAAADDEGLWTFERRWQEGRHREARATADGRRLVFASYAQLTSYETDGHKQIYLYDAAANGGAGELACVSCNPLASGSTADADLYSFLEVEERRAGTETGMPERLPRNLSANGTTAFFETAERLVPGDTNARRDVYRWSDEGLDLSGELALISSGQGAYRSEFLDASESGDDVFYLTREQLVPSDTDHQIDVYDARVGGGLESQQGREPRDCEGDACQDPPSAPPAATDPASSGLVGPGNPAVDQGKAKRCERLDRRTKQATRKVKRLKRKAKRASGAKAKRLKRKSETQAKKAKRLKRKANQCERRSRK